jgi:hypothetical protein
MMKVKIIGTFAAVLKKRGKAVRQITHPPGCEGC